MVREPRRENGLTVQESWGTPGGRILWASTLAPSVTLAQRIAAAGENGFGHVSFAPQECWPLMESRRERDRLLGSAKDLGAGADFLDCVTEWHPHAAPRREFPPSRFSVDDALTICNRLHARNLTAISAFPHDLPEADIAECFARLCDRAADEGLRVHLEFTPMSQIHDLPTAYRIVNLAGRTNGGILFDTWHFFRGNPDMQCLADIPAGSIFSVQVSDAAEIVVRNLFYDTYHHRLPPGQGCFDLRGVLSLLSGAVGPALIGPEIISDDLHALSPARAAAAAARSLDELLLTLPAK